MIYFSTNDFHRLRLKDTQLVETLNLQDIVKCPQSIRLKAEAVSETKDKLSQKLTA